MKSFGRVISTEFLVFSETSAHGDQLSCEVEKDVQFPIC